VKHLTTRVTNKNRIYETISNQMKFGE